MPGPIRILMVDDHPVVLAGLNALIGADPDFLIVCKARDAASPQGGQTAELSEREADVLRLVAGGHSNKAISARLGISVKTVETYKARAMEKLGFRSRVDVVRYAADQGWLREQ